MHRPNTPKPSDSILTGTRAPIPHSNLAVNGNGHVHSPYSVPDTNIVIDSPASSAYTSSSSDISPRSLQNPINSPCFVHSHLDKGASFTDWLKRPSNHSPDLGVAKALQPTHHDHVIDHGKRYRKLPNGQVIPVPYKDGTVSDAYEEYEDEEETSGSLTKQLAETAVGVREMSKQLGRARIKSNIQNVLIVTKARDNRLIKLTRELALYLMQKRRHGGRGLVVYVDHQLRTSRRFDAAGIERDHPEFFDPFPRRRSSSNNSTSSIPTMTSMKDAGSTAGSEEGQLRYWTSEMCSRSPHLFDFVVTLGGDGTVLFTSWLFQRIVPPVLSFALGSLGFLTNFDFADHQAVMDNVIESGIRVNLRMRFTCTVYRAVRGDEARKSKRKAVKKGDTGEIMMRNLEKGGWEALEGGSHERENRSSKDKEIMCFTTRPVESFEVLNDLVVDRGPSPYVSMLELFGDEHHMTTVQGDGLTISTPTGSTAYSLSAGGSLAHPEIPAILITPIAPHTLSFRPMLLPDSMEVRVCVPFNSRSTAWVSFDGRGRVELKQGDHIKVTASKYPYPTVCADKQSTDWFHAISRTLRWNDRERQKSFVVVEEEPVKNKKQRADSHASTDSTASLQSVSRLARATEGDQRQNDDNVDEEDSSDDDEEEEEEEKFDIDDLTPETQTVDIGRGATPQTLDTAQSKANEQQLPSHQAERAAAEAMVGAQISNMQSSSRSGLHSGVETPSRFANGEPPHLPRHVQFTASGDPLPHGHRHPHLSHLHARDDMRTPTVAEHTEKRQRSRSRQRWAQEEVAPSVHPRAFAVWGQDESDSGLSDTDI
ncbi:ATP-NAD kinase-like domain-containing protein [Amylostereum chailletii]|nr:ATP-NAD kinase-like domain-containing protein [Amylostereum chailletii]